MRRPNIVFIATLIALLYWLELGWTILACLALATAVTVAAEFAQFKWGMQPVDPSTAVLITGCSSGFGFDAARHLADAGMTVFAGVRRLEDAAELVKGSPDRAKRIIPVVIDITKPEQIAGCLAEVKKSLDKTGLKLHALVNNAGITCNLPTEIIPEKEFRQLWEVNYFGTLNVTKAFLPLLRGAPLGKARVIFIGSLSASGVTKFFGGYPSTKVAIEVTADELRRELSPWKIQVSVIEPGMFETKLIKHSATAKNAFDSLLQTSPDQAEPYKARYAKFVEKALNPPPIPGNKVSAVSQSIEYSIRARVAPAKRGVGIDAHVLQAFVMLVPDSVIDFLSNLVL